MKIDLNYIRWGEPIGVRTLVMAREHYQVICQLCEKGYPTVTGGFLIGKCVFQGRYVETFLPLTYYLPQVREEVLSITVEQAQWAADKAQERDCEVLGLYLSRPNRPALLPQVGRHKTIPFWSYLCIAVEHGRTTTTASFYSNAEQSVFSEESFGVTSVG